MASSAELPAHLQEIIDKGYIMDRVSADELRSGGIHFIDKGGTELRDGAGEHEGKTVQSVAFCFDGPFLPVRNGASYSLYNLLNALGKDGSVLPILILCDRGDSVENYYNQHFKTIFVDPEYYYNHNERTAEIFTKNHISAVQFCSSEGLLNLGPYVKKLGLKVIFDVQNVDYVLEERLGHSKEVIENAKQLQVTAINKSDYILCRSEVDRVQLIELGAQPERLGVYNGGIDVDAFTPRQEAPSGMKLVFLAHMYYEPNENALAFMVREVLPRLRSGYTLTVIGNTPDAVINQYYDNDAVIFRQGVDNLSEELVRYDVAVAPIFEASGTRLKVLDYLAAGVPAVTTDIAIEGLVEGIKNVVSIANDPDSTVAAIEAIVRNPHDFATRSHNGREYVRSFYDWKNLLGPFLRAYAGITKDS